MKQTLKIISHEPKIGKDKKTVYGVFETSNGKYSCFKEHALPDLIKNVGNIVDVEITKKGEYNNITEYHGPGDTSNLPNQDITVEKVGPTAPFVQPVQEIQTRYRTNIKQNAKGHHYYECTVESSPENHQKHLDDCTDIARLKCEALNMELPEKEGSE